MSLSNYPETAFDTLIDLGFLDVPRVCQWSEEVHHSAMSHFALGCVSNNCDRLHKFALYYRSSEVQRQLPAELRRRVFDVRKPNWKTSVHTWWASAVFKAQEVQAAKAQEEKTKHLARARAIATVQTELQDELTVEQLKTLFDVNFNPKTGTITSVEYRYRSYNLSNGFKGLAPMDQLHRAIRIARVLKQEGFLDNP